MANLAVCIEVDSDNFEEISDEITIEVASAAPDAWDYNTEEEPTMTFMIDEDSDNIEKVKQALKAFLSDGRITRIIVENEDTSEEDFWS